MRIGIIGTGHLGRSLARRWAERGHEIYFGSRHPEERAATLAALLGFESQIVSPHDAAGADVVVLAVPAEVAADVAASLDDLEGRVLVDCTVSAEAGSASVAEAIADRAENARVVKAFNTVHPDLLGRSDLDELRPFAPLCGDDPEARATVAELAHDLGLSPTDCGGLHNAHLLESMAQLRNVLRAAGHPAQLAFGLVSDDEALSHARMARRQTRDNRPPVK